MNVEFIDVDVQQFKDKVAGVQEEMLKKNSHIQELYDYIQKINEKYTGEEAE